jgi:hypothetical protein
MPKPFAVAVIAPFGDTDLLVVRVPLDRFVLNWGADVAGPSRPIRRDTRMNASIGFASGMMPSHPVAGA